MGTKAFNMHIPDKLKFLKVDTDDIDLKIYTTELHYDKSKNDFRKTKNVISLFRYIIIVLFIFMKQIIHEIIDYTQLLFTKEKHNSEHKQININQKHYGIMKTYKLSIQIKNNKDIQNNQENIDLTDLSYDDIYKLIFTKINDIDLLITSKIKYNIKYSNIIKVPKIRSTFTFSDTKIYYPNLYENTTFYAHYLLNKHKYKNAMAKKLNDLTLHNLDKLDININEIIKVKNCNRYSLNCNYIAIDALKLDLILMLQYAEFINNEENTIIVPISSLFKYIKYFKKYLYLFIIIKFYNKTLTKEYIQISIKLLLFIQSLLINYNTDPINNNSIKNKNYKKILNKFHQDFFINKTMFPEYNLLKNVVDDYNHIKIYINKSRYLFQELFNIYI